MKKKRVRNVKDRKFYWQASSIHEQVATVISLLFGVKALFVGGRACTHLLATSLYADYTAA